MSPASILSESVNGLREAARNLQLAYKLETRDPAILNRKRTAIKKAVREAFNLHKSSRKRDKQDALSLELFFIQEYTDLSANELIILLNLKLHRDTVAKRIRKIAAIRIKNNFDKPLSEKIILIENNLKKQSLQ